MFRVLISETADVRDFEKPDMEYFYQPGIFKDMDAFVAACAGCDAVIIRNETTLKQDFFNRMEEMPRLKAIGRLGAGLDNVDLDLAKKHNLAVVYTPDANTESTAQYCLAAALSALRMIPQAHVSTRSGAWNRSFIGRDFTALTLGIIGYGRIGKRFSELFRALGGQIIAHSRTPKPEENGVTFHSLEDVCEQADIVSVHVSLNDQTRHLLAQPLFDRMKKDVLFINAARGGVVKEPDLVSFLSANRQAMAVLDVRDKEPPQDNLFMDLPNVILTPHIAAFTDAAMKSVNRTVAQDIFAVLNGQKQQYPAA